VDLSRKLLWNVYVGVAGAATALAVNKALKGVWRFATGEEPPAVDDPGIPAHKAITWAVASAAGMAVAAVMVTRLAARSWERTLGVPAPIRSS